MASAALIAALLFGAAPAMAEAPEPSPREAGALPDQPSSEGMEVRVVHGRLSVRAEGVMFGALFRGIANAAGFEAVISPDVAGRVISSTFRDIPLETGLQRLLRLINHRNFFMFYGPEGELRKIEIYGASASTPQTRPGAQTSPAPRTQQPTGRIPRAGIPGVDSPGAPMGIVPMGTEGYPPTAPSPDEFEDEPDAGVPYIPPTQEPEYIPPTRRLTP
jgi:hypothetical protein